MSLYHILGANYIVLGHMDEINMFSVSEDDQNMETTVSVICSTIP